jgi:hypothetical protein
MTDPSIDSARFGGEPLQRVALEGMYSPVESWRVRQICLAGGSRERLHAWQLYRPAYPNAGETLGKTLRR